MSSNNPPNDPPNIDKHPHPPPAGTSPSTPDIQLHPIEPSPQLPIDASQQPIDASQQPIDASQLPIDASQQPTDTLPHPTLPQFAGTLPQSSDVVPHRPEGHPSSRLSYFSQSSVNSEEEDDSFPKSAGFADQIKDILRDGEDVDAEFLLNQHVLFIQMDILCSFPCHTYGWKEMSRWLKYEEKVDASGRWSKPHVSTVSLRALTELKHLIHTDKVALMFDFDTQGRAWSDVIGMIVESVTKELGLSQRSAYRLSSILAAPHKHKGREGSKKTKDGTTRKKESLRRKSFIRKEGKGLWNTCTTYPKHLLPEDLEPYQADKNLRNKLPKHAEVGNVWVGCIDFCSKPICFLCRFKEPLLLDEASEVDLPSRLLFVALSNQATLWQMNEMGRAVAILFNDKIFCEIAYKSESKEDLLTGLNELMDDVCILPPSIWDPTTRLDPPPVTMTMERICRRLESSQRTAAQVEQISGDCLSTDDSLKRTHSFFGGLVKDVKRRYPQMKSDIIDGFSVQCISSIIFLFFACITPIVTFGGLMSSMTGGNLGTIEMLLSGTFCGITYAIFSGQPLTIVGATGPLLVFESILYNLCTMYGVTYLPLRCWIGVWTFLIMMLIVAFDLSALIKYITRFTEESFSVLISLIFVWEALEKLYETWKRNKIHTNVINEPPNYFCYCNITSAASLYDPLIESLGLECRAVGYEISRTCLSTAQCEQLNGTVMGSGCTPAVIDSVPDVFLLSTLFLFGTFAVAIFFRRLRASTFFPQIMRRGLANFAVVLSLILWTTVDYLLGLNTAKLDIPVKFQTTNEDRGWFVNPLSLNPWWTGLLAVFPACLSTILIFLDQQITAVIVNRKENKLEKGHGYHLDLFLLSFQILFCSFFGLPWFCAATVRSISHVQSLVKMTEFNAPGEAPKMLGVREQRVTGFCIHVLIGLSLFGATFLKVIPMPVLYGVFFFMGVTSLEGVQFVDRVLLLLMPMKDQPDFVYLRHVETRYVHLFTAIQIFFTLLMWVVKSFEATSLAFPLTLLVLVLVRKLLDKVFTQKDLFWLDNILPESTRRTKEDQIRALDFAHLPSERRRSTRMAENYYCPSSKTSPMPH